MKRELFKSILTVLLVASLLPGCSKRDEPQSTETATPPAENAQSVGEAPASPPPMVETDASAEKSAPAQKRNLTSFDVPQTYTGTIPFKRSKTVTISLTLSEDTKQVTQIKFSAKSLYLEPKKAGKGNAGKSIYKYAEGASVQTNLSIAKTPEGYNVMARDKSGNPIVDSLNFTGGILNVKPIDVVNGKISSDSGLLFDLTVSEACIYGKIKVEIEGGTTSWANVIAKNMTTPQDISTEPQCSDAVKP